MNRREMVAFAGARAATALASPRVDPARVRVRKSGKVQNIKRFAAGKPLINAVDKQKGY